MWRLAVKRGGQCVVVGYKRFRIQPSQQIEFQSARLRTLG